MVVPINQETNITHPAIGIHLSNKVSSQDFFAKLASLLGEVPCDWEVISLKSRCPFGQCVSQHVSRVMVDGNGATCSGLNFGFFGMLYKEGSAPASR